MRYFRWCRQLVMDGASAEDSKSLCVSLYDTLEDATTLHADGDGDMHARDFEVYAVEVTKVADVHYKRMVSHVTSASRTVAPRHERPDGS